MLISYVFWRYYIIKTREKNMDNRRKILKHCICYYDYYHLIHLGTETIMMVLRIEKNEVIDSNKELWLYCYYLSLRLI